MKVIERDYKWVGSLTGRSDTKYIIIHHRAGIGDVDSIHKAHINNGWSGIGYHFYIRANGDVYRGRPIGVVGAHCIGHNKDSLGICFEGNYETETTMPDAQIKAGQELIFFLQTMYPDTEVKRHCDFTATACPGRYFPFDVIKKGARQELTSANDIIWELTQMIEINDVNRAVSALEAAKREDSSLYWILRKIVNKG